MAAYPTYDPLAQIGGFAGGNLADQLRRSRLPVEPQRWVQSLPAPPTDTPIPDDYMALGANPAPLPVAQPVQPAQPAPAAPKQHGISGLNTVGQALLKHIRSQPVETPADTATTNEPTIHELPTPPVQYPAEPPPSMRLSTLASKLAQARELENAPLNTPVTADSWGLPQVGETKPMSKKHAALIGLLQGALAGGAAGGWKGAIGGAATGGIAGAVDPKLIYALEKRQEQDRLQGDINTEFGNRTKQAQLGDIAAQTQQRSLEPIIEQYKINEQNNRANAAEAGRNARSQAAIEAANTRQQRAIKAASDRETRQEQRRQAAAARPQYRTDPTTGDIIEIAPGVSGKGATSRVLRKGGKQAQKASEAKTFWDTAGRMYDDEKGGYEALKSQADDLRSQAEKLGSDDEGKPSMANSVKNATQIKVLGARADKLDAQAEDLKKKVQDLQSKGDQAYAESGQNQQPAKPSKGKGPATGGTFNFSAWKADHPNATPAEVQAIRQRATANKLRIVE